MFSLLCLKPKHGGAFLVPISVLSRARSIYPLRDPTPVCTSGKGTALSTLQTGSERKALKKREGGHWWLTPVILATQEAEIRRIVDQSQPRKILHEILS
jgi:hypothetical protein